MDETILYLINTQWTSPMLDFFMVLVSSLSIWMPIFIALAVILAIFGRFRTRVAVLCIACVIGVGDGLVSNNLKKLIARPRPEKIVEGIRMLDFQKASPRVLAIAKPLKVKISNPKPGPKHGRSFPSGHTINTFGVATVFALFYRFGWMIYLVAAIVGYSRVYVGSHWPSDVCVSTIIGIGVALLTVSILDLAWKRLAPRFSPTLFANHPTLRPHPEINPLPRENPTPA